MRPRVPLPAEFSRGPFRTTDARRAGIGEGRLRSRDLARPFHGIRTVSPGTDVVARSRAFAPLLRAGDRFSHLTAAALWGLPLPAVADHVIHVSSPLAANPPRGRGVIGHRARATSSIEHEGMPTSTFAEIFCELSMQLDLDDLVAVGDALVLEPRVLEPHDARPFLSLEQLRRAAADFTGRGCRCARRAAALVRVGAESRPETLLRLLLHRAGLPEPAVNPEVRDTRGRLIGYADLLFVEQRVVVEYDGDQHRTDARQYDLDQRRVERFLAEGYGVVRIRSRGLFATPGDTVTRVARALRFSESTLRRR